VHPIPHPQTTAMGIREAIGVAAIAISGVIKLVQRFSEILTQY